jgi:3-isopropylmalate dehydrogenase
MALLLAWHSERSGEARFESAARAIENAVAAAIEGGQSTRDVGGSLGTTATGQAIVEILTSNET